MSIFRSRQSSTLFVAELGVDTGQQNKFIVRFNKQKICNEGHIMKDRMEMQGFETVGNYELEESLGGNF